MPFKFDRDKYIMLMASLPRPGPLFAEKQTPLSRLRLDRRLRALTPQDAALLRAVEQALEWRLMGVDATDAEVIACAERALAMTDSEALRSLIKSRMEIRTCLSALRRRAAGEDPPPAGAPWGYGRWRARMVQHWRSPGFGVERMFPWLKEADRLLREGDVYGLERLVLEVVYRDLSRRGGLHQFDIEAVVIYVLKWSVIDRWSRYNAEAASRRFADLLTAGLAAAADHVRAGGFSGAAQPAGAPA